MFLNQKLTLVLRCYLEKYFHDELRGFNSSAQFDGLLDDLNEFQNALGINTEDEQEITSGAKGELEDKQSAYEDHMQDAWKEQNYENRADEKSVRELFSSLTLE